MTLTQILATQNFFKLGTLEAISAMLNSRRRKSYEDWNSALFQLPGNCMECFRFGNFALKEDDEVKVFLLAKGAECESLDTDNFQVTRQMKAFVVALV